MATFHISDYFASQLRNRLIPQLRVGYDGSHVSRFKHLFLPEVILFPNYFLLLKEQIKELEDTSN